MSLRLTSQLCVQEKGKIIRISKQSRRRLNRRAGSGRRLLSDLTETKASSSFSLILFNIERRARPSTDFLAYLAFLLLFQGDKIRLFILFARTGAKTIRTKTKTKSEIVAYVAWKYTSKRETLLAPCLIAWHDGLQSY